MNTDFTLFSDIQNRKFWYKKFNYTLGVLEQGHDIQAIMEDPRYTGAAAWFQEMYSERGYGYNSLIKEFCLRITYPVLRSVVLKGLFVDKPRRGQNVVTDRVRNLRRDRAVRQAADPSSTFGTQQACFNSRRGVQGYYFNRSLKKHVWLRSTYEYIFAKWLDKHGKTWDVEVMDYVLQNGESYRPDFFIFTDSGAIDTIVEVKGYYKNRAHKPSMLNSMLDIPVSVITDVRPFSEKSYDLEKKEWKQLRLSEQELKKLT